MALQEARLVRPKDKKFDWNKIKKVGVFESIYQLCRYSS